MCRTNLETVLSGLSLYVKASYDLILALVLGVSESRSLSLPKLIDANLGGIGHLFN